MELYRHKKWFMFYTYIYWLVVEVRIPHHIRESRFCRSEDRYPYSYRPLYEYVDVEMLGGIGYLRDGGRNNSDMQGMGDRHINIDAVWLQKDTVCVDEI